MFLGAIANLWNCCNTWKLIDIFILYIIAEAAPSNTLIVKNLAYKVTEKALRKVFDNAVSIDIPLSNGKSSG